MGRFVMGLTLFTAPESQPFTVGISSSIGNYTVQWNYLVAGSAVAIVPVVILFTCSRAARGLRPHGRLREIARSTGAAPPLGWQGCGSGAVLRPSGERLDVLLSRPELGLVA
jgi:hypothetical protein